MGTAWVTCDNCRRTAAEGDMLLTDDGEYCDPDCRRADTPADSVSEYLDGCDFVTSWFWTGDDGIQVMWGVGDIGRHYHEKVERHGYEFKYLKAHERIDGDGTWLEVFYEVSE